MNVDLKNIREKIRNLRNKTVANGCTEAEANSAMAMAFRLMSEYGLDDGDLEFEQLRADSYGARRTVVDGLWAVVGKVCACHVYYEKSDRTRIVYTGRPVDVAVAEYLHDLLSSAVKFATGEFRKHPEYTKRRKAKTRNAAVKAFQLALVARLAKRLGDLWWTRAEATGDAEKFYLDHTSHIERISADIARRGVEFVNRPSLKLPDRRFDGARVVGYRAGDKVTIDPGVTGASRDPLLLQGGGNG
ncbi:MAG: DUF2786 domain-containing protein [Rhodospirillales bacterium]|nr:DUF2786 domain-containing protein [Rhodospirillales bacterium]